MNCEYCRCGSVHAAGCQCRCHKLRDILLDSMRDKKYDNLKKELNRIGEIAEKKRKEEIACPRLVYDEERQKNLENVTKILEDAHIVLLDL